MRKQNIQFRRFGLVQNNNISRRASSVDKQSEEVCSRDGHNPALFEGNVGGLSSCQIGKLPLLAMIPAKHETQMSVVGDVSTVFLARL